MTSLPEPRIAILGRNVGILALKRGWCLEELAEKVGVAHRTILKLHKVRTRYIDPDLLYSLFQVLECTPNDLLLPMEGVAYD